MRRTSARFNGITDLSGMPILVVGYSLRDRCLFIENQMRLRPVLNSLFALNAGLSGQELKEYLEG